jgi:hypothetical protein
MEHPGEESDQLPEEGPAGQVEEDTGEGERDEAKDSPGARDDDEDATGNPDNAG